MNQRDKIVARAAKLFEASGIKSIRMDDIAQDLSISKRTLYEMFANKEELLYDSFRYLRKCDDAELEKKLDIERDGIPSLFKIFEHMFKISESRQRMYGNLRKFYPELFETLRCEQRNKGLARLHAITYQLLDMGLIDPKVNIDLAITMFYYTSNGLFLQQQTLVLPEGVTMRQAIEYMFVNFFRGIATLKGVEQIDRYMEEHPYNSDK